MKASFGMSSNIRYTDIVGNCFKGIDTSSEKEKEKETRPCSSYWDQPFLVRWVDWVFSCSIGEKLVSVGLVDELFFNQPLTRLKRLKSMIISRDCSSRKGYSQELPRCNRKKSFHAICNEDCKQ